MPDTGVNISVLKLPGGWTSERTAQRYITNSENNKRQIAGQILGVKSRKTEGVVATVSQNEPVDDNLIVGAEGGYSFANQSQVNVLQHVNIPMRGIEIHNLNNCTLHFYQK